MALFKHLKTVLVLSTVIPGSLLLFLLLVLLCWGCCSSRGGETCESSLEAGKSRRPEAEGGESMESEKLMIFAGGEGLTAADILEAPGEVVGRSTYGTLYRARVRFGVVLLRFLRPACAERAVEVSSAVRAIGSVQHPNLVPLRALYVGPRGEKLFVHPYYAAGNLSRFLRDGVAESHRWDIVFKLSIGIARGLDHLHTGLQRPIIHGNLKTNNVLLDADLQPRLSDFGLHAMLNAAAAQEMLEVSALQGYKAPELMKMKDASRATDIYSLGVVMLEMLTQREPAKCVSTQGEDVQSLQHKIYETFCSELVANSKNASNGEEWTKFLQLAMACCSPYPKLRPDTKAVLKWLQEIGEIAQ